MSGFILDYDELRRAALDKYVFFNKEPNFFFRSDFLEKINSVKIPWIYNLNVPILFFNFLQFHDIVIDFNKDE